MSVHSGGTPVDPAVAAATMAALPEAREVVIVATAAMHLGEATTVADVLHGFVDRGAGPVGRSGRINALITTLLHVGAQLATRGGSAGAGVVGLVAPQGADATRRAALAAVSCAANADMPAATDVLLAHTRARAQDEQAWAELLIDLCVVVDELAGDLAGGADRRRD